MGRIDPQAPLSEILTVHSSAKDSWNLMRVAPNCKFLGGSNQKKKNPPFLLECFLKKKRNFNMQTHKSETLLTLNVQSSITLALSVVVACAVSEHRSRAPVESYGVVYCTPQALSLFLESCGSCVTLHKLCHCFLSHGTLCCVSHCVCVLSS